MTVWGPRYELANVLLAATEHPACDSVGDETTPARVVGAAGGGLPHGPSVPPETGTGPAGKQQGR